MRTGEMGLSLIGSRLKEAREGEPQNWARLRMESSWYGVLWLDN